MSNAVTPAQTADKLRRIADAIEAGEIEIKWNRNEKQTD